MPSPVSLKVSKLPVTQDNLLSAVQREIKPVLDKVRDTLNQLLDEDAWLTGVLLEEDLSSGANTLEHGLGSEPSGFRIEYMERPSGSTTAAHVFYRDGDMWSDSEVELYATDTCTVKIWLW